MDDSAIGKYYFSQTNFSMLHQLICDYFAQKHKIRIGKDFNNIILDSMKCTYAQKHNVDEAYTYNINDYISALNRPVLGDVVQRISDNISKDRPRSNNMVPSRPAAQDTTNRKNHGADLRRLMDERAEISVPTSVDEPAYDDKGTGLSDELYGSLQPNIEVAQNTVAGSHRSQEYIIPRPAGQQQLPTEILDSKNNTMELFEHVQKTRSETEASLAAVPKGRSGVPLPTIPEETLDTVTEPSPSQQEQSDTISWTPLSELTENSLFLPIGADFDDDDIMPQSESSAAAESNLQPTPRLQPPQLATRKANNANVEEPAKLMSSTGASLKQSDIISKALYPFPEILKDLPRVVSDMSQKLDLIADRAHSTQKLLSIIDSKAQDVAESLQKHTAHVLPLRMIISSLQRASGSKTNSFTVLISNSCAAVHVLSVYIPKVAHLMPVIMVKINDIEQPCEIENLAACECVVLRVDHKIMLSGGSGLHLELRDSHGCLLELPNDEKVIKSCASTPSGYLFGTEESHGLRFGDKAYVQHLVSDDTDLDAALTHPEGHKVLVVDAAHFEIILPEWRNRLPLFRTFGKVRTENQQVQIMYTVA